MTFKVCNLGSKQPYFNKAYVVRVYLFMVRTVGRFEWNMIILCVFYDEKKLQCAGGKIILVIFNHLFRKEGEEAPLRCQQFQ